jgi:hypothetical protein
MSSVSTSSNPSTPMGSKRMQHQQQQHGTMEQHMLDGMYPVDFSKNLAAAIL